MATSKDNIYATLSKINVNPYIDRKMGLSYLSWAKAWGLVKSIYPDVKKKISKFPEYLPTQEGWMATGRKVDYQLTQAGCEVEVTVIFDEDHQYSAQLYVMDNRNRPVKNPDIAQINKAQMRCLVKALAFAGLGLNIYAGEDLPSGQDDPQPRKQAHTVRKPVKKTQNAREAPKTYTPEELRTAKVNYQGQTVLLYTVYNKAFNQSDKQAQAWWKENYSEDKPLGNLLIQFTKLANAMKKQNPMEAIKNESSNN